MSETRINVSQTTITAEDVGASSAVDTMPIASASNLGKIVQYVGNNDGYDVAVVDPHEEIESEDVTIDASKFKNFVKSKFKSYDIYTKYEINIYDNDGGTISIMEGIHPGYGFSDYKELGITLNSDFTQNYEDAGAIDASESSGSSSGSEPVQTILSFYAVLNENYDDINAKITIIEPSSGDYPTIDSKVFANKVSQIDGTYLFRYMGESSHTLQQGWYIKTDSPNGEGYRLIDLSEYGITFSSISYNSKTLELQLDVDVDIKNGYFYKCVSDLQEPATYNWENIEVQPAGDSFPDQTDNAGKFLTTDGTNVSWENIEGSLPSQAGNSGKFLTTDGTNASWGNALKNNDPTNDKLIIGNGATATYPNSQSIVVVGAYATGSDHYATAIGTRARATYMGTAIGREAHSDFGGVAIGVYATTSASSCMQISLSGGYGVDKTNSDANTVKISNQNGNFEMMSADGTIPEARLADTTNAQQGDVLTLDANGNAVWQAGGGGSGIVATTGSLLVANWDPTTHSQTITVTGLTATKNVLVSPAPASTADYIAGGIICSGQLNNTLTFTCTTIPSADITVNMMIFD